MSKEKIKVYLADDHQVVRQALAEMITRTGRFEVVGECGNGLAVLPEVQATKPDVLVLDVTMPGMSGLDVCREITRRVRNLPVLILSMHEDEEFVARALVYGACGYLLKEADKDQFLQALERVSRGELYLSPRIPRSVLARLSRTAQDPYDRLTVRERQVLHMIAEGKTNREIAEVLNLAVKTIDTHRTRLMRKLGIHDQTSLVKYAIRKGIVSLE